MATYLTCFDNCALIYNNCLFLKKTSPYEVTIWRKKQAKCAWLCPTVLSRGMHVAAGGNMGVEGAMN